ncbi:unnamed protein product, partial [Polarella glacialis]
KPQAAATSSRGWEAAEVDNAEASLPAAGSSHGTGRGFGGRGFGGSTAPESSGRGSGGRGIGRGGGGGRGQHFGREESWPTQGQSSGSAEARAPKAVAEKPRSRPEAEKTRRPLADMLDYIRTCSKTLDGGLGSQEEEGMLASRALEEMGDRVLLVAADQRGSKPLEKLLRKAAPEAFAVAFSALIEALPDLAPNQYGSHVLEAGLASWAERLGLEEPFRPPAAPLVSLCSRLREDGGWPALVSDP